MYAQKKTSNSKNLKQNTDLGGKERSNPFFGSLLIPPFLARGGGIKVKTVDDNPTLLSKHFPPAIKEWQNSVYTYNPKLTISLLVIDQMIIKIITSYLNSFYLEDQNKNHLVRQKIHSHYMNKVYIAQPEVKHTNSKVVITIYIYSGGFKNLEILYKHLEDVTKTSLAGLLAKLYNKKVVFRVIQLRYLQLNSSILAQHLADALAKGGRNPLGLLRRAFRNVRIPKIDHHSLDKSSLKNSTLLGRISTLSIEDINKLTRNEILLSTNYKRISGLRIQIAGRLNRRAVAARSTVKTDQVGYLKNIDSSFRGRTVGLIRGYLRPNLDIAYCNHKTRNGAFNVKV